MNFESRWSRKHCGAIIFTMRLNYTPFAPIPPLFSPSLCASALHLRRETQQVRFQLRLDRHQLKGWGMSGGHRVKHSTKRNQFELVFIWQPSAHEVDGWNCL